MPGNKKASLHLDGFFHPGSRSIQGRLLSPCSCGIGIYPAQNPPGETQTPPKDGVWVLGDTPAWLGQVISLNTIIHTPRGGSAFPKNSRKPANKAWRKILLPVAHSLLISGDQEKKKTFGDPICNPRASNPSWIFHLSLALSKVCCSSLPRGEAQRGWKPRRSFSHGIGNEGIVGSSQPRSLCSTFSVPEGLLRPKAW